MQLYSCLVVFLCFGGFVHPQTHANLNGLLGTIFNDYNPRIRPIQDQTEPIFLDISMFLFSINKVDEVNKKLVTTGYLELTWTDGLLKWSPDLWNDTTYLTVPQVIFSCLYCRNLRKNHPNINSRCMFWNFQHSLLLATKLVDKIQKSVKFGFKKAIPISTLYWILTTLFLSNGWKSVEISSFKIK